MVKTQQLMDFLLIFPSWRNWTLSEVQEYEKSL